MATLSQALREDFLTCKVCLNIYDTPKILPCLHTYCRNCLLQLIQREDSELFPCPECRRSTTVPNRDPDQFQTNFYVQGLIEAFTIDKCCVCKLRGLEKSSSHQCIDCGDSLCDSCSEGHLASRSTVNHRVVTLQDVASGRYDQEIQSKKQVYCGEHKDKECSFYCKTCQKAVCVACALLVHKNHQLSNLEDGSLEAHDNANTVLQKGQNVLKSLASHWSIVQKNIKETQERQLSTLTEIEIATEQIIQLINVQKEQTLKVLQDAYEAEIRQHTMLKQEIDAVGKAGRKLVDSVQAIVQGGSGSQMLLLNETLQHGLAQLVESNQNLLQKVVPETDITFTINPALYQVLQSPVFSIGFKNESVAQPTVSVENNGESIKSPQANAQYPPGFAMSTDTVNPQIYANNEAASSHVKPSKSTTTVPEMPEERTRQDGLSQKSVDIVKLKREELEIEEQDHHSSRLRQSLQNLKILDPPASTQTSSSSPPGLVVSADSLQTSAPPAEKSSQLSTMVVSSGPAVKSYSDVLKLSSSVSLISGAAAQASAGKSSKVQLNLASKLLPAVKKDEAEPEIMGMALFGHDRILLTDSANGKVKSFLKDCTTGFVKEFRKDEFTPSSIAAIKDVVAFTLKDSVHIVTKQYVKISTIKLSAASPTENNYMFPICVYDEDSFLVSNIVGNKQWLLKINGEFIKDLQCPAKSPVFAISRDSNKNFYISSWGQPGSLVVTDESYKRLMILQPLFDGKPAMEWFPGYSACDRAGNIFVADGHHDKIVVFNRYGKHIVNYSTKADELAQPMCLIIDQKETLYVTGKNKHIFVYKIKRKKNSTEKP